MTFKPSQPTLHVTIRIDPSNLKTFLEALRTCWQGCFSEPECLLFETFHDPENPGTLRFVEVWKKDEKWFGVHQLTKGYYEPYHTITKPMWLLPREMLYTVRVEWWSSVAEEYLDGAIRK